MKLVSLCRIVKLISLFMIFTNANAVSLASSGSRNEPGGVRYYITVTDWLSGNGFGFCTDFDAMKCDLFIVAVGESDELLKHAVFSEYRWNGMNSKLSLRELYEEMRKQGFSVPFYGSIFVPSSYKKPDDFCISFGAQYQFLGSKGPEYRIGPCARVAKPPLECSVSGNTTINHGTINDNAVNGNEATTQLQLRCTGSSSLIVTASKENLLGVKLRADGSLYSKLTIEGKPAAEGVSVPIMEGVSKAISLKSTLYSSGAVESGSFSGSTVMTITSP
ncbi:hypothetical protein [Pseudomonas protegens]|uniref:MrpH family fimbial adhesin n=1 Tax=Pseudomonas protegens TaxID=380021 RepID=UPI00383BCA02